MLFGRFFGCFAALSNYQPSLEPMVFKFQGYAVSRLKKRVAVEFSKGNRGWGVVGTWNLSSVTLSIYIGLGFLS
jgi:hypothetical protein